MKHTYRQFRDLIKSDVYRQTVGSKGRLSFWKCLITNPWFKAVYYFRICQYLKSNRIWKFTIYPLFLFLRFRNSLRFGIEIDLSMDIGPGFRVEHFGGIFLSPKTKIGRNCSISYGVVMGYLPRGINKGYPVSIGDNVYIGPGAKIIGNIKVGNNVVIGANSVVTKDIPDNVTVFGVPARVVSQEGSQGYINLKVEE